MAKNRGVDFSSAGVAISFMWNSWPFIMSHLAGRWVEQRAAVLGLTVVLSFLRILDHCWKLFYPQLQHLQTFTATWKAPGFSFPAGMVSLVSGEVKSEDLRSCYMPTCPLSDSSDRFDGPICAPLSAWKRKTQSPPSRDVSPLYFLLRFCWWFCSPHFRILRWQGLLIFGSHTSQFSTEVLHWFYVVLGFGPWTYQISEVLAGSTKQICSCWSCPAVLDQDGNFWMWSILPLYTGQSNFLALEQASIQLWQPRLNIPFVY